MTFGTELATTRQSSNATRRAQKQSKRRTFASMIAALAACGFLAAYLVPAGVAMAEAEPETTSLFEQSVAGAQSTDVSEEVVVSGIGERSSFEVYVKPKPTPTPEPAPASSDGGSSSAPSAPVGYSGGGSKDEWLAASGIPQADWGYVDFIVAKESGWNPNATNASSGACGLVQALPCSKVPGSGYNPVDNLRWANGYAVGRYGSWGAAYAFWTSNHWW